MDEKPYKPLDAEPWCQSLTVEISDWLHRLILTETCKQKARCTIFHGATAPEMSIRDYIRRIVKYCELQQPELLAAMLYIRRLVRRYPHFPCSDRSMHRTVLTAVLVATKMHRDNTYSNEFYARVGGIPVRELARLERCILELLEYRLFVSVDEYQSEVAQWRTRCE